MHDYGVPTDTVRVVLALGVVLSIVVYQRWRVAGGASFVAGYLALFLGRPLHIVTTLGLAIGTHYFVQRVIAPRMFLYGRRRLVMRVLVGIALQSILALVASLCGAEATWLVGLYGVGFVLPGLIAQDMELQGVRVTALTVLGTALITYLVYRGVVAAEGLLPPEWSMVASSTRPLRYGYHSHMLMPAVVLSVVIGALLFEWVGIRSGGFLTAAYAALFVLQPIHLLFVVGAGVLVYLLVVRVLMPMTPVFGRTKFAMVLLVSLASTWALEAIVTRTTNGAFVPFAGFSNISPMIAALIANDGERQGLPKTLVGVGACTLLVYVAINGMDLLVHL